MKTLGRALVIIVVFAGCGGNEDPEAGWTPRAEVQDFDGDIGPGENRRHAEAIIRHHREDHCGQELIEVRCEERASRWLCEWRTGEGDGDTLLEKQPPSGSIPVECG